MAGLTTPGGGGATLIVMRKLVLATACFTVALTGPADAAKHTVSGVACIPYGNPSLDWSNISYTSYGPANHSGTTARTMVCPITSLPTQPTNAPTYYLSGYDRDPSDEIVIWFCAYQDDGNGAVCQTTGSGTTFVGAFGVTHLPSTAIPSGGYFLVWATLPKVWVGQVSHVTTLGVEQ